MTVATADPGWDEQTGGDQALVGAGPVDGDDPSDRGAAVGDDQLLSRRTCSIHLLSPARSSRMPTSTVDPFM
jgi:hypothetical protein